MKQEKVALVAKRDLIVIYDTLLRLCGEEGCVVIEQLANTCSPSQAHRIYNEVFSDENLFG